MKKHHRTIRIVYFTVVILGSLLVGALISAFDLEGTIRQVVYWGWLALIGICPLFVNFLWQRKLSRKINELTPILYRDPDLYIQQIHNLLDDMRSKPLRQLLIINHAAALCCKKDYPAALSMLEQIPSNKVISIYRPVYWADLALTYFYLDEDEKASQIMQAQQATFAKWKDSQHLGGTLAVLSIFDLLSKKEYEQAQEALDTLRPRWEDEHNAEDFQLLQKRCDAQKKDSESSL